ncbi:MAG: hypothetical protein U9O94_07575 [Nanoarchaeota archaeon]|nr:hypothetical protein [Nanoarchaeota archaeon]
MKREMLKSVLVLLVLSGLTSIVMAAPWGADAVDRVSDVIGAPGGDSPQAVYAQAGNMTELELNASVVSQKWQGYYGNITSKFTLADASGYILYDWSYDEDAALTGEIYAANQSVPDWGNIQCVNLTGNGTIDSHGDGINVSLLETLYGMGFTDKDGFDETFNSTRNVTVGTTTLDKCPSTNMYVDNATSNVWNETLLTLNDTLMLIFATEVENNREGFNDKNWDFQMIVADNGDITEPTSYQFYVELT